MAHTHIVKSYDEELAQLYGQLDLMGEKVVAQLNQALKSLESKDVKLAKEVIEGDRLVDQLEHDIDVFAVRIIALRQPLAQDLRVIIAALKISSHLERIADYAGNIARRVESLAATDITTPLTIIKSMILKVGDMITASLEAFKESDLQRAMMVWHQDREVDAAYNSYLREILTYMLEHPKEIGAYIDLLFVGKHLERAGDHVTDIAEMVYYLVEGVPFEATDGWGKTKQG